jgi:hypothetical protein
MKLAITIALLMFLQTSQRVPRAAAKNGDSKAEASQNKGTPDQTQTPQSVAPSNPSTTPGGQQTGRQVTPDNEKPADVRISSVDVNKAPWDFAYIGASLLIALATLVLAGTAWVQASAAKNAAKAAFLNAKAVIDSERAWLIPAAESIEPNELPAGILANSQVETLTVRIENCGRTPAWLMDWFIGPVVSEDASIGQITNAARPEGNFPHARPFPHTRIEDFWFEWTTSKAEIGQIKAGQKHLYIWGFLQYRSIASDEPRVSRFCFHYFHRRNSRGSFDEGWTMEPPEENYYT